MKVSLSCVEVARVSLGEPIRQAGQELFYRCPNHDDEHPSLKVNKGKNVWMCGPCGASGNAWQLAVFIGKLDPNDKEGVVSWLKERGLSIRTGNHPHMPITVADLARDKSLPTAFLEGLGLRNVTDGVLIPYHLIDGSEAPRHRLRTDLVAKDGSLWDGAKGEDIVPYGLEKSLEARTAGFIVLVEGESDRWTLTYHGFPALGIPGAMMAKSLRFEHVAEITEVYIFQEPDKGGEEFLTRASKQLTGIGWLGQILVVTLDGFKDPNELHKANSAEFKQKFQAALDAARPLKAEMPTGFAGGARTSPWSLAVGMNEFLGGEEESLEFMLPRVIVKGAVVGVFSPRGLGKSLWELSVAVSLAKAGIKVFLIDRDNPRRTVRERLRAFGATADLSNLKVLSRENAPPLTDSASWREFPYADFDLVILDSLDSAAEGIGEQDSAKPSKAIAPLLDIAHRENGPAVLVLGNCIRTGAHSRGSGVIEDRADIVFEVRDATGLCPSGEKPWVEELPPADAGSWVSRSSRRKHREKYRLAFIATKFRIGEEPDPFILEIDLTTDPWSVLDVTDVVDRQGKEERQQRAREKTETVRRAREDLVREIRRRHQENLVPMLKDKHAVPFLTALGLTRNAARELLNNPQGAWELHKLEGVKGHPVAVRLATQPEGKDGGGNVAPPEAAFTGAFHNTDFREPHLEPTAEIPTPQESENKDATEPPIPAVVPVCSGLFEQKSESKKEIASPDFDEEMTI